MIQISILVCGLLMFAWECVSTAEPQGQDPKPNIVLIMTDDQGFGDLHFNGNSAIDTPTMDRIGNEGCRFDRFYVSPMCAPTRASLLTGRYNLRTGVSWVAHGEETMRLDELTIADVLSRAGYATGCFGKWHNGEYGPYHPNYRGFGTFFGFCRGAWENYFDPVLEHNRKPVQTRGYITDILTDAALAFIEENRDRPFFCYIPYNAPHHPYQVPALYFEKYKKRGFENRTASVYGMVENIDDNLARILDKLEALHLTSQTLIFFLSDNGPYWTNNPRFNAGMRGKKAEVDEGGVRVPLFLRWPGHILTGRTVTQTAAHIDLFPTILDLCRIPLPPFVHLDGRSLVPLLSGKPADWPDRMIFTQQNRNAETQMTPGAVRTQQYRLINRGDGDELYDMFGDPGQLKDVSAAHPEITRKLSEAYEQWYRKATSRGVTPPPIPVGHPGADVTAMQGEDALLQGGLQWRGHQGWAHDSILNWKSTADVATWKMDVLESGRYEVILMYRCPQAGVGARIQIKAGSQTVGAGITKAHDPQRPSKGMAVVTGPPVWVMSWAALTFPPFTLEKGRTDLEVRALTIPGNEAWELKEARIRLLR